MAIEVRCGHCGKNMRVKDSMSGSRGLCPFCQAEIDVPHVAVAISADQIDQHFEAHNQTESSDDYLPDPLQQLRTRQAPAPIINETSAPAAPKAGGEETVYKDGDVTVTTMRVMVGGTTYALRNITSVRMGTKPPNQIGPGLVILVGVCLVVFAFMAEEFFVDGLNYFAFGASLIVGGLFWLTELVPNYYLVFSSSSGEVQAFTSKNQSQIQKIVAGVNEAIIRYH
jgi:hypothetical protein